MRVRIHILAPLAFLALVPAALYAQHGSSAAPARTTRPPREASQFDFLIGQWELRVTPKVSGLVARLHGVPVLRGSWKAWRTLDGWGVEDQLRIVDESGNPQSLTAFVRLYDPAGRQWLVAGADAYRQTMTQSRARWTGSEMVSTSEGRDADGAAYLTRTRIMRITPDGFRMQQDRSTDGGKSWDEARLVIEARRTAPTAPR